MFLAGWECFSCCCEPSAGPRTVIIPAEMSRKSAKWRGEQPPRSHNWCQLMFRNSDFQRSKTGQLKGDALERSCVSVSVSLFLTSSARDVWKVGHTSYLFVLRSKWKVTRRACFAVHTQTCTYTQTHTQCPLITTLLFGACSCNCRTFLDRQFGG